jgi:hypothetical protein
MTTPLALVCFILAIILWLLALLPRMTPVRLELLIGGLIAFALPFALAAAHVG